MKGEGKNCELAECAMRRGVSVRAYEAAEEETANAGGEGACVVSQKNGEEEEKRRGGGERKSTSFYSISPCSQKMKYFSRERFDYSKLKSYFCA